MIDEGALKGEVFIRNALLMLGTVPPRAVERSMVMRFFPGFFLSCNNNDTDLEDKKGERANRLIMKPSLTSFVSVL